MLVAVIFVVQRKKEAVTRYIVGILNMIVDVEYGEQVVMMEYI
jgi:hypothetical protein